MDKVPLWKPLLIAFVLALSIAAIIPPSQKLKPGLDLAGGTVFIYQVNVPPGSDAQKDIDDTITVLQNRVDPTGVKNLIWRQLAGHRIEIQMAVASPEATKRRDEFAVLRKALFDQNLSGHDLDAYLRATPQERSAMLAKLGAGSPERQSALQALAEAEDRVAAAQKPQEEAQKKVRKAEAELAALSSDASEAKRKALVESIKPLQAELTARTRALLEARRQAKVANAAMEATNIKPAELERVLGSPDKMDTNPNDDKGGLVNLREAAVAELVAAHRSRADQIHGLMKAYAEFEKIKGPMDDPNDLIELLRSSGVLEFRIAASSTIPNAAQYREQLQTRGPRGGEGEYIWVPIDDPASFASTPDQVKFLKQNPEQYFGGRSMVAQSYGNRIYLLLGNTRENSLTHDRDTWALTDALPQPDEMGFPGVGFELDASGGQLMGNLTGANIGHPMAIVLDGKVMTAPNVHGRINGRGSITGGKGGFSEKELTYIVRTLKAGSLKARLSESPISIQKVGAQFGTDNLRSGTIAATATFAIVAAFMICYYFIPGLVATFALAANIVITMGAMAMSNSTFTLPGIAGIILTIGMAVDANVLVFERIREELERKNSARTAIRLGFGKAMATIIDTHLTTILTCIILFYVGTADIKGFAVTLGVGLIASLFTAVFCSRVMLDLYLYYTKATTLGMLPVKYPGIHEFFSPSIDWYGKRYFFVGISLVLTVGGALGVAVRGVDFLDIEFRSGTQVGFRLREGAPSLSITDVRHRLNAVSEGQQKALKARREPLAQQVQAASGPQKATLEQSLKELDTQILQASYLHGDRATVVSVGDTTAGGKATAFNIATLATDPKFVTDGVKDAFQDVMSQVRPVSFEGMERTDAGPPYVFPVRGSSLGDVIERGDVRGEVNPDYVGGVAIVLKNLNPAVTVKQVRERLESAQFQPEFEAMGYHAYDLQGVDAADPAEAAAGASTAPSAADEQRFKTIVLLTRDDAFNYAKSPDTLGEKGGLADTQWRLVNAALRRDTSLDSVSSFSSQISGTMQQQAIVAIVLGWAVMMAYIWMRFGNLRFGVGALLALIHDVITAIGLAALCFYVYDTSIGHWLLLQPFRLNLALVAAVLTLIGYSVNDTIVVFDRIRENRGKLTVLTPGLINDSINQTISRTVLTAGTVLIACFCLYVLGGEAVRGFAFVMFVGSIIGCYSSIAVASPLLLVGLKGLDKAAESRPSTAVTTTTSTTGE
ncbi:MAG: protein translocase subunit SecD [Planctomycetota bacterium]|nr:protein translocase subunit SecD [Planctomycetota bacterium]